MPGSASNLAVLVIGGGTEAVPGIERVLGLGRRVAVADGDPKAPGFDLAHERLVVSTYDCTGVANAAQQLHRRFPIGGVLSIACDVPLTVATVADRLHLPGISQGTAALCMDKLAMKARFNQKGVPIPWYEAALDVSQLDEAIERSGAVVIKPVDSRGARGVLLLTDAVDTKWALEQARSASPSGRAMLEQFLPGPQLSTESIILDGRVFTLGCSDRNYDRMTEFAPHFIEDGGCQPSAYLDQVLNSVDEVIGRAAQAIGMTRGVLKGDLVLVPGRGPVVIEVAPRLSGGWFCTDQIPYSTGVDLVQLQAQLALGKTLSPSELTPSHWHPIAVRYAFPGQGRLLKVEGVEALKNEPWCKRVHVFAQPGDWLEAPTNHTGRAAVVLASAPTRTEAIARAKQGVERLHFTVEESGESSNEASDTVQTTNHAA